MAEETDAEKAVALTRQLKPDLVLMDIELVGAISGLEAARQILKEQRMPIMILTAYDDEGHRCDAEEIGVCGYLVKPFISEQLLPAMEEAFARFHAMTERVQQ